MPSNQPLLLVVAPSVLFVFGCSNAKSEAAAARPPAGSPVAGPGDATGGRGGQTLSLAPTDISIARPASLVDGVPITGNLRPIETVAVRARLEGDLEGIYVREGDYVRAGQLLARFESTEQESGLQSAAADRAAAEGDLATAEWNLRQSEDLFKAGAIAEGELRVARNAVGTARARLAAASSRVRSSSSSRRDTRVLAPTGGIVEKRFVENGEHIARGAQMFSVVRNTVLELAAAVPEKLANAVAPGQSVEFLANARSISGRVARVSPTVDPVSRSVTVYVQVPNPDGSLKGGTFATGTVLARTISDALTVPTSAVKQTATGGSIVYRVEGGALDTASVEIGVRDERRGIVQIIAGLAAGDSVVSGNVGSLGKGMKVNVVSPTGGRRGASAPGAQPTRQN
ncbi:MAG TPA: efflux RND transporter periplasmic adaptor subunit [Gemmatimonadaceae bacterium]|nr:efflux RND transporter periplasmic adaptor subunit [Gemmatimonadaceae bacterium]